MTLAQLRSLVTLDNIRHFRRAAAHLGISQPSLSNQLNNLEAELEVQLFDRSKKPIAPTQVGEQVIAQARLIVGETDRLKLIVKGMAGEMAGQLRVGILPTLAPYLVPGVLTHFSERYTDVVLELHEMSEKQIMANIKHDQVDVGIVTTSYASRGIAELPLFDEPLICYVSENHRLYTCKQVRSKDLSLEGLWLLKEGNALRDQVLKLCSLDPGGTSHKRRISFESDSLEALKRLVENGQGMAVLPGLSLVDPAPHNASLIRPFSKPAPHRIVRMVYPKTLLQERLVKTLAADIQEAAGALLQGPNYELSA